MKYSIDNSELVATNDGGSVAWRRLIDDTSVVGFAPLDGSEGGCLVLLDPDARISIRFQNIVRVDEAGTIKWRAMLPKSKTNDCYVSLRRLGGRIVANTWSGFLVPFDLADGTILDQVFVK